MKFIFLFSVLSVFAQTTYYVSTNGSDSSNCGDLNNRCSSINQVITNYPGLSYSVSISEGTYPLNAVILQRDAYIILEGEGNPTITASWTGVLITNTATSGFEIHDLFLTLSGSGTSLTQLNTASNTVGIYNIVLTYSGYSNDFIDVNGGALKVSNVTLENTKFDGYFISATSKGIDGATGVSVRNLTLNNIIIGTNGGIVVYDVYNGADSAVNNSHFENISSSGAVIAFWARNSSQTISITFNQLFDVSSSLPTVYILNTYQSTAYVQNTTWVNATSDHTSGALEIDGPNDGQEHAVLLLQTLNFAHCSGPSVGGLYVSYASFALNNTVFILNEGKDASDVVLEIGSTSTSSPSYDYYFTSTCSSSAQKRAVVAYAAEGTQDDISGQIPNCRCLSDHFTDCREGILYALLVDAASGHDHKK